MSFKSKKTPFILLGITSLLCSRAMFAFFDDPEGPNLLIVTVMAAVLYTLSLATCSFKPVSHKKVLLTVLVQVLLATAFYFVLR